MKHTFLNSVKNCFNHTSGHSVCVRSPGSVRGPGERGGPVEVCLEGGKELNGDLASLASLSSSMRSNPVSTAS